MEVGLYILSILSFILFVSLLSAGRQKSEFQQKINLLSWDKQNLANKNNDFQKLINKLQEQIARLSSDNKNLIVKNKELEKINKNLSKYQDIVDAKEEAKKIRETIKQKTGEAENYLNSSIQFYHETMEQARIRANEILVSANEKLPKAQEILATAEAMQNVIESYGGKYIIPGYSVFDELAYEYGFDESGQQLKLARDHTRLMIETGKAATCDYVERNRKEIAINFVIDAFNGKVDSILSAAKIENGSTLIQKIKDAYWNVNDLGAAFRNARILPDYLDSRTDELKWLIRVNEIIQRRKDEQRELREEERDAAKAKREAEKQFVKTQKEIASLGKERDTITKQIKDSKTDDEKAALIKKLRELEEKLKEKNIISTRAKSMTEFTTIGNVYIISNQGSFGENVYKIGLTRRWNREDRIRELYNASVPFPFEICGWINSDKAPDVERALHNKFAIRRLNKVNVFKEYFRLSLDEIKKFTELLGYNVEWTLAGKAHEYVESLKISKQLKEGSLSKEEYLKKWLKSSK